MFAMPLSFLYENVFDHKAALGVHRILNFNHTTFFTRVGARITWQFNDPLCFNNGRTENI